MLISFLSNQIKAGAQAVQIFESYAGELSVDDFKEFSLAYVDEISTAVKKAHPNTPIIFFPKGQSSGLRSTFQLANVDAISLDWTVNTEEVLSLSKEFNKVIQGNLDPGLLVTTSNIVRDRVKYHMRSFYGIRFFNFSFVGKT